MRGPPTVHSRNSAAGTRGPQGTLWLDEQQNLRQTPAFPVHTVDTLGARDIFHGAFALALPRNRNSGRRCTLPRPQQP
jgi:sugar/nucleoside kinase (ribokinase family)